MLVDELEHGEYGRGLERFFGRLDTFGSDWIGSESLIDIFLMTESSIALFRTDQWLVKCICDLVCRSARFIVTC